MIESDGLSSFLEKKDFDPSGFCIKSSYQDPVREFSFFLVFGPHFREKCVVFIGFYTGFVASGIFPVDPPFPPFPAETTSGQAESTQGSPAPGSRMTVVCHKLPQMIAGKVNKT